MQTGFHLVKRTEMRIPESKEKEGSYNPIDRAIYWQLTLSKHLLILYFFVETIRQTDPYFLKFFKPNL